MDKYDEAKKILMENVDPGERRDAEILLTVLTDVCRGIEQIGSDIDRIATALETRK